MFAYVLYCLILKNSLKYHYFQLRICKVFEKSFPYLLRALTVDLAPEDLMSTERPTKLDMRDRRSTV